MKPTTIGVYLTMALLGGCGGGVVPHSEAAEAGTPIAVAGLPPVAANAAQSVFWTLYAGCSFPQIQFAAAPMERTSPTTNYSCSQRNGLGYTSGLRVDSLGHLWVLTFGKYGGNPASVKVFKLPLKASSRPLHTFVLTGSDGPDAMIFDPSGNLWTTSRGNKSILEYKGPFTKSRTLKPAFTLTNPCCDPSGIAFDQSGNLYASNFNSTGTNSIGVLAKPYTGTPYWLEGLTAPGGLAFDKNGNLYASTNGAHPAVVRYDSDDLKNGDAPSIVDSAGLPARSYEAAFAFTSNGSLYAANCGNESSAGIDVWPLSRKKFSSSLSPSVLYTNADVQQAGCAWGIAIK